MLAWTQEGNDVRLGDWTAREIEVLNSWQLLTAKPVVYLVNMSAKVRLSRSHHLTAIGSPSWYWKLAVVSA